MQAMQFSNGLTDPVGLWLGHLMFDTIAVVVLSTVIIIIFATLSNQFHGLGFLVSFQILNPGRSPTERIPVVYPRPLWHHCCPLLLLYFPEGFISIGSICHCRGISIHYIYCKHALSILEGLAKQYSALYFFLPPRFNVWQGLRIR